MTNPKYASQQHREERAKWKPIVDAGQAECAEPICLKASRWIAPGSTWDVSHTPDGTSYLGASHAKCNRSEGARRGNRSRKSSRTKRATSMWWRP